MIQLEGISKSYGSDLLFTDLNWQLLPGSRVGLVGPNGAGKTTLMRILVGHEEPDQGRVILPRDCRVGYLPQELEHFEEGSVLDIILSGRADLLALEERIAELEEIMASEEGAGERLAGEYSDAQDRFRREGGYELRSRAREIGAGIGFEDAALDEPISTFSGGWKMRALLARLLLSRPDLLLLDEPTNHLDVESIEWLEHFLIQYPGTVITISHDRFFLNRIVHTIAELHGQGLSIYHGDYDDYLKERELRRERLLAAASQQEKERERIEEFVERFRYKATKARQVQSRVKHLEKMDLVEVPPGYEAEINFVFPAPPRMGKVVLDGRGISKRYGDHIIYEGLDFQLHRGERVAFVGPNGAGKSTLLKILAGELRPDKGQVERGSRVEIAYFAQHSVDQLDLSRTILEEMEAAASYESAPNIRSILGAFLFSGDDVHKKISVLSGGEKNRVALAKLLLEPAGCLLLDEPTNHLDIPSRRVLEHALQNFEGAFCVISHDRYFLQEVVNRVVHIEAGEVRDYPGTYDEYRWRRAREAEAAEGLQDPQNKPTDDGEAEVVSRRDLRRLRAELRDEKNAEIGALGKELAALEAEIESLESELEVLEARLADPQTYEGSGEKIVELQKQHLQVEERLMSAMQEWEERGELLDEIEKKYAAKEAALEQ